ncbi:uncharacterized protein VTP21DRAFT_8670 [Calcarisporiella thermophila]|uniref:uncharacterized protein n=1 Tax=Calcarisporiella thermophila TaxID=911321 RepID=UPI0037427495
MDECRPQNQQQPNCDSTSNPPENVVHVSTSSDIPTTVLSVESLDKDGLNQNSSSRFHEKKSAKMEMRIPLPSNKFTHEWNLELEKRRGEERMSGILRTNRRQNSSKSVDFTPESKLAEPHTPQPRTPYPQGAEYNPLEEQFIQTESTPIKVPQRIFPRDAKRHQRKKLAETVMEIGVAFVIIVVVLFALNRS